MALKNHALDDGILSAALKEFRENGYKNASMRKIALSAGVTIGAIYTRFPTKDALFRSLVQPLINRITEAYSEIRRGYYNQPDLEPAHMSVAMAMESDKILHLLFDDYERATLLLCRSTGSSLETFFDEIVELKIKDTFAYFQSAGAPHWDQRALKLLIGGQFHMYIQIIRSGCDLETAQDLMRIAIVYHSGGWMALLNSEKNRKADD